MIAKSTLKTLTPAPRQTYLYGAARHPAQWVPRLKTSRLQLKKATHFYSFVLIFIHFYSFLLILKCVKNSVLQNVLPF